MTIDTCARCGELHADLNTDRICSDCARTPAPIDPDPLRLADFDPTLACTTPVGQTWIARQHQVVATLATFWQAEAITTPDTEAAAIDALFAKPGPHGLQLTGLVEVKCRDLTIEKLYALGSYLITKRKLDEGSALASALRVPFTLAVGLTDGVVYWHITDAGGRFLLPMRAKTTHTQATANGGDADRENAYIPLDAMQVIVGTVTPAKPSVVVEVEQPDGTFTPIGAIAAIPDDFAKPAEAVDPSLWED